MKKLIILSAGFTIFVINVVFGTECVQPHTTHNVGHQFYEALIETPKDAIVKGAVATKELGKDVASTLVSSSAAHDLKDAAKELVVEAPVKTAEAIKNGTVKAYDNTKRGAKIAYDAVIRRPAYKIKDAAHQVAHGTKETVVEVGEQIAEVGHDVVSATKHGAHKVYHVMVEKPVGAIKAAVHYLKDEDNAKANVCEHDVCVLVLPAPLITNKTVEYEDCGSPCINNASHVTSITVMPSSWLNNSVEIVRADTLRANREEIDIEFLVDTPRDLNEEEYSLSQNTINQLVNAYQSVQADLKNPR